MPNRSMVCIVGLLLFNAAFCETLKLDELSPFSERVMENVAKGDLDAAFLAMKPYVIIPDIEYETLSVNSRAQRGLVGSRFGKTIGYECLDSERVGQSLVRITCIEKTEKHALPWRFYFYKSPSGWVLNTFNWSDNMPSLFSGT